MSEISDNITLCDLKCVTGEDYRYYITPDGKKYYSTTTVVNWDKREFFKEWRKNNPNKSKNILNRGTAVHEMAEEYCKNGICPSSEDKTINEMHSNLTSMIDTLDEIVGVEIPLYSDTLELAGRTDCVGILNGELCIIDFKTSQKIKPKKWLTEYWCQATAYAIMWQERTGIPVPKIAIMMVSEDGKKKLFTRNSMEFVPLLKDKIDRFKEESGSIQVSNR